MWLICGLVAAGLTLRAMKPERLTHWWDYSRAAALIGTACTFGLLFLVSWLGVSAADLLSGRSELSLGQQITAALASQASLRRMRSSGRGETLALGLIPDVHKWVDHFVRLKIGARASEMTDDQLVAAAARLDPKLKGIPTRASLEQRTDWRVKTAARLDQPGLERDEARQELVDLITTGYSTYALRRPR